MKKGTGQVQNYKLERGRLGEKIMQKDPFTLKFGYILGILPIFCIVLQNVNKIKQIFNISKGFHPVLEMKKNPVGRSGPWHHITGQTCGNMHVKKCGSWAAHM